MKPADIPAFHPARWLRGGHVQTLASFLMSRRIHLPPAEERLMEVEQGVSVKCLCHWQKERSAAPAVIVVHGLEGSTDSQYMLGMAKYGLDAGMNVVLMNQRNCGGMDHCAPTLYNSDRSADVAAVARHIVKQDGIRAFGLAGFSMGGNLVLKLAGEWGNEGPAEFRAVAGVCPAMDLGASADALHEPANRIYEYYFLMQLFRRFRLKSKLFPADFDVRRLRGISSLRAFDERITSHYCGFAGAEDYYQKASATNRLDDIAVPALIIHSTNDPFIRLREETRRKIGANRNIQFVETKDGGHCAFIGRKNGNPGDDGRWAEMEVVNFFSRLVR